MIALEDSSLRPSYRIIPRPYCRTCWDYEMSIKPSLPCTSRVQPHMKKVGLRMRWCGTCLKNQSAQLSSDPKIRSTAGGTVPT